MQGNLYSEKEVADLGSHLRTVREFKGFSRKTVSESCNVSEPWLKKFELGTLKNSVPTKEKIQEYSNFLGIEIEVKYTFEVK